MGQVADRVSAPGSTLAGQVADAADSGARRIADAVDGGAQRLAEAVRAIPQQLPGGQGALRVRLDPTGADATADECLWHGIREATDGLSFAEYSDFIDSLLCDNPGSASSRSLSQAMVELRNNIRLRGVYGTDAYQLLKAATELFLALRARTVQQAVDRCGRPHVAGLSSEYLVALRGLANVRGLPYMKVIVDHLGSVDRAHDLGLGEACSGILPSRAGSPVMLELIWSYWHEQAMLVQGINAVALRFQNIRRGGAADPLARLELDPLRPLNNLLWGYLQDEQNRLSVRRRAYEYDHHYGLRLQGKAVEGLSPADSRTRFLPALHALLYRAWVFIKERQILTVQADPFPVLNALRELHLVLAEGAHNQFGDLPTQARAEMRMQQWLLGRGEMREFLGGRAMVPYPERWMDRVDTLRGMFGWGNVSVVHYNTLATFGEQLLLSVRYGDWHNLVNGNDRAANWVTFWRDAIQQYLHAYQAVTGVDLTMTAVSTVPAYARDAQPASLGQNGAAARAIAAAGYGAAAQPAMAAPRAAAALPPGPPVPTPTPRGARVTG
jgi:hypothetical protein